MNEAIRTQRIGPPTVNDGDIDALTMQRLRQYAGRAQSDIDQRLRELQGAWTAERVLGVNAAAAGVAGLVLGARIDRRWLLVPGVVFAFIAQHAIQGWCPPVSLMRRMGIRTRREIERERYALKALRGDFEGARGRSQAAARAVR